MIDGHALNTIHHTSEVILLARNVARAMPARETLQELTSTL
jgi:hypothetical protein